MRILHVITGLKKAAGTSTFCGEVCNQLASLGHDVTNAVCNPSDPDIYPLDSRIHLVSIASILHSTPTPTPYTYSLVHIHGLWSWPLHQVSSWACAQKIPVVWSTHGMTAPWALKHKWWKKCLPWFLYQKRDLKKARLIHCTSDFEIEWNQRLGFKRTFLAPLGTFLPEEYRPHADSSTSKTLLFVGRIYPVKALDRLIEAFSKVRQVEVERCKEWVLRIVGPDQAGHMAELMSLCDRLGLSYSTPEGKVIIHAKPAPDFKITIRPAVEFVGPKFGKELDDEYANCDALALVSHTENFGATVVDAMAYGKPVVTSTKTPWKIVVDRECGWWVDNDVESLSEALSQLSSQSDSQILAMGERGRKLVEDKYTWPAIGKQMIIEYNKLVK